MVRTSKRPAVLRDSWRPAGSPISYWRWLRRLLMVLLLLGLLSGLYYLVFAPFWHPNSHLLLLAGTNYDKLGTPGNRYALRDLTQLAPLEAAFVGLAGARDTAIRELDSPEALGAMGPALEELDLANADVLIVYVSTHGIAIDGKAYLLSENFDPTVPEAGRYPLAKLLQHMLLAPAGVQLLVLDSTYLNYDAPLGLVVNEFPAAVQREVEALGDERLFVLTAHSAMERPHTSRRWAQSVFGRYVAQGLQGAADLNGNQRIELDELYRYVRLQVSQWARLAGDGTASQTPQLFHGGRRGLPAPPHVLLSTALPVVQESAASADKNDPAVTSATPDSPTPAASSPALAQAPEANSSPSLDDPAFANNEAAMREEARRLVDQVLARQTALANPIDYAPHYWSELSSRLRAHEQHAAPHVNAWRTPEARIKDLREIVAGLQGAISGSGAADERFPWLDEFRPRVSLDPQEIHSLGLLEQLAKIQPSRLTAEQRAFIEAFDQALAASERKLFDELIAQPANSEFSRWYEVRVARQLASRPTLDWSTIRLALQVCRMGEQVAADELCLIPEIQKQIESGDRLRLHGIRRLLDELGTDYSSHATELLQSAFKHYHLAARQLQLVRQSNMLRNDLLLRAPWYVQLRHASADFPGMPTTEQLGDLLNSLAKLCASLEDPHATRLDDLQRQRERLLVLSKAIEQSLRTAAMEIADQSVDDDSGWLERFLSTPLPDARTREQLLSRRQLAKAPAVRELTPDELRGSALSPPTLPSRDWSRAAEQLRLEIQLAALAALHVRDDDHMVDQLESRFAELFRKPATVSSESAERNWAAHREVGAMLERLYRGLPGRIARVVSQTRDFSQTPTRPELLARLRAVERALHRVDYRDNRFVDAASVGHRLRDAATYDLMTWQGDRFREAIRDAPGDDPQYYRQAASRYRLLALSIPQQPPNPVPPPPTLHIEGTTAMSLAAQPEQRIRLGVTYRGGDPQPIWLILQFDPELIELETQPADRIFVESKLRDELRHASTAARQALDEWLSQGVPAEQLPQDDLRERLEANVRLAERATQYPLRPDLSSLPPSRVAAPGVPQTFEILVRARAKHPQPTKLIVKAVGGNDYVRHEMAVILPGSETLVLSVAEEHDRWAALDAGVELHPLPSHTTNYRCLLANRSGGPITVDVELLSPRRAIAEVIPQFSLSAATLVPFLDRLGPLDSLLTIEKLSLPPGNVPTPLLFRPPLPPESAAGGETIAAPAPSEKAASFDVRHGLLLRITDRETQQTTLRRMDFKPLRPRSYLQAQASYDANQQRLTVRVTPRDQSLVPAQGFRVRCELAQPLPAGFASRLEGVISAPGFAAIMYAEVPPSIDRVVTLYVHVDDYPRAFVFRIPCAQSVASISELIDVAEIRIVAPATQQSLAAPISSIPVQLQVDAPVGAFETSGDQIEVGLDVNRDREFRDEATVRVDTDRQADIVLRGFDASGILAFDTTVHDLKLDVPSGNLRNARANLLARMQLGRIIRWSEPVEIVVDGVGPSIDRVELLPDRVVVAETELTVRVWASDRELSGVQQVEVAWDVAGTGEMGESNPAVKATREPSGPVWGAKLPTSGMELGAKTILVRATDKVGNASPLSKVRLELVSQEDGEARRQAAAGRLAGKVYYGGVPLAGAKVELEGEIQIPPETSADSGAFSFANVPPGKYKLKAQGLARNKPRFAEIEELVIEAGTGTVQRIRVDVR